MTEQETITISKEKYDEIMEYINEGSVPIEEHIELMKEHIKVQDKYLNQLAENIETSKKYIECTTILNEKIENEITNTNRKINNFSEGGISKYAGKIKFGLNYKFELKTTVKFQIKDDIDFGVAVVEIADIIERFGEK